ncbi:MAG: hypothetical protein JKY92_01605 [Magnetovibrio sp.]|nr:hypothetical protein [Magnetovibrio sp.]
MIDVEQFRNDVVQPVLKELNLWSESAEELIMGTAAQESNLVYLKQTGSGPALGICQMEPATHDDIWDNYLRYQTEKSTAMKDMFGVVAGDARHLTWNLGYAVAMCRICYSRAPSALPDADSVEGMAEYWKDHYNTPMGAGTVDEFINNYDTIVKGDE